MKCLFLIFTGLVFSFTTNSAFADCKMDADWPDKPCLDMPPYPKSTLVQIWDDYYSMKGQEWMEGKRSEMNYAIEKAILEEWLSHGTQQNNFQNHNAYFYYFLHDEAPATGIYLEGLIRGEDQNNNAAKYSDSGKDSYEVILTYYYISTGGLFVLSTLVAGSGIIVFLIWRKRR